MEESVGERAVRDEEQVGAGSAGAGAGKRRLGAGRMGAATGMTGIYVNIHAGMGHSALLRILMPRRPGQDRGMACGIKARTSPLP